MFTSWFRRVHHVVALACSAVEEWQVQGARRFSAELRGVSLSGSAIPSARLPSASRAWPRHWQRSQAGSVPRPCHVFRAAEPSWRALVPPLMYRRVHCSSQIGARRVLRETTP